MNSPENAGSWARAGPRITSSRTSRESAAGGTVTVDELFLFAVVLDVPPLLLMLPDHDRAAVTPDLIVDPMRLALWVNGLQAVPGVPSIRFSKAAAPIALYRAAYDAIEAAKNADRALAAARDGEGKQMAAADRDSALRRLADTIRPVLLDGFVPSGLPAGWLDEMTSRGWLEPGIVPARNGADDGPR